VAASFALLLALYAAGFTCKGLYQHRSLDDTAFLHDVDERVPAGHAVLLHTDPEALEGLRQLFYFAEGRAVLLHNLTFLRDDRLAGPDLYLVSRAREQARIDHYGQSEVLLQSKSSRRERDSLDRWTLFHVHLHPGLQRKPGAVRITPMQSMYRIEGPSLD
jgi:hypothetical protein